MSDGLEFKLECIEMASHHATLRYTGAMCKDGALALDSQLTRLFGYYQYPRIHLNIESPGGDIEGLEYALRSLSKWAKEGRQVAVESKFKCASAAACLLSMGEWGLRKVDLGTYVLFHNARIQSTAQTELTARVSKQLSTVLDDLDRRLLDIIVGKMLFETRGPQGLVKLVLARARFLDYNWKEVAANLTTLTQVVRSDRKPDWLKNMLRWERNVTDPQKFIREMKTHLVSRFQSDARIDLCEAFALLLIDEIDGALDQSCVALDVPRPIEPQTFDAAEEVTLDETCLFERQFHPA